jgi:hypothetical protein
MRAPLHLSVRQNSRIFDGARRAASTKRCRSAALRYFRLPDRLKEIEAIVRLIAHSNLG